MLFKECAYLLTKPFNRIFNFSQSIWPGMWRREGGGLAAPMVSGQRRIVLELHIV